MTYVLQQWLTRYGEEALWRSFSNTTVVRGLAYAREERVVGNLTQYADRFEGVVAGSGRRRYSTSVLINAPGARRAVDTDCSCPVGAQCKHGVAVLATLLQEMTAPVSPDDDDFPPVHYPDSPRSSFDSDRAEMRRNFDAALLDVWVGQLREAGQKPASVNEGLVYAVHVGPNGELAVTAYKTRIRKDGHYGQLKRYRGDGATGARFLQPTDERILRMLDSGEGVVRAALVPTMLSELASTGRAHPVDTHGPVLTLGPAAAARFEWSMDNAGQQRLVARVADRGDTAHVLAGKPPWYLDTGTGAVGPAEMDFPDHLVTTLLNAPPVPPDAVEQVQAPLKALKGAVPLPQVPEHRSVDHVAPTPHLHCFLEDLFPDDEMDLDLDPEDRRVPMAAVHFDYNGIAVPASEPGEAVTRQQDGVLWRIQRDLRAERTALQSVAQRGLRRIDLPEGPVLMPDEDHDWLHIMAQTVPALRAAGWHVHIADDFPFRLVEADAWYADLDEGEGNAWFELELGVEVEGERHALLPILTDLIQRNPEAMSQSHLDAIDPESSLLVDLGDGRLLPVPAARLVPMLRTLSELYDPNRSRERATLQLPALRAGALVELEADEGLQWRGGEALREFGRRLGRLGAVTPVDPPTGLNGTLRTYQREGVGWLQSLSSQGLGGVLADDMGLGKTVQILGHLLLELESGRAQAPSLVVAPLSLLFNWEREAERFAPGLRVLRLHGSQRHQAMDRLGDYDLILTTYALVTRDVAKLCEHSFHLLVLDEAQAVKNPTAQSARAVRQLTAQQRLCLTGTPLENHLGELWAQFDFLLPGLLGERKEFSRLFRRPIEQNGDAGRQQALQHRIQPFLLRRTKAAIARELPEKTEIRREVQLTGAQRDLYETVRVAMHKRVRDAIAERGLERSQVVVLDALLKLRQVCCDPRLVKLDAAQQVQKSGKLDLLMELLHEAVGEGRRVLVFSQFTAMLGLIEQALAGTGIDYVKLTGQTRKREERVNRFQAGEVPVFLISLKAGGTGLNLTAADTVIHYDPWWNPAVMQQATDRTHRIGQTQPVFVYHLLTRDTVEEKIVGLQQRKADLGDWLLGGGEGRTAALQPADVEALFAPLDE